MKSTINLMDHGIRSQKRTKVLRSSHLHTYSAPALFLIVGKFPDVNVTIRKIMGLQLNFLVSFSI